MHLFNFQSSVEVCYIINTRKKLLAKKKKDTVKFVVLYIPVNLFH